MWADERLDKRRHLRALAIAALLIGSVMLIVQDTSQRGSAVTPSFTRPNVKVDSNAGSVGITSPGGPTIAMDNIGKLHAVWMDNSSIGGDRGIYYANSSDGGATWSTPQRRIDGFAGFNSYAPSIAVDKSGGAYTGRIYVAWQVMIGGQYDIYVISSNDGGNTWSALDRHQIDNGVSTATITKVAVDTDGWVYVTFQDMRNANLDVFVARSSDGGATWMAETPISTSLNGDAYASVSAYGGTICIGWQEASAASTNLWLACSRNRGNGWQMNAIISVPAGSGDARFVSVAVDTIGSVHVAFTKQDAGGQVWIAYARSADLGGSWTALAQVDDVAPSILYMPNGVTILQSSGVLYVVWSDNRNGDNDIFASWSEDNGATWGDGVLNNNDIRVDDTDENAPGDDNTEQTSPCAAPGPLGVYAIWSDRRDFITYHAYFAGFEVSEMMLTEFRDSPDGLEEVEILNHGGRAIDMTGWGLMIDAVRIDLTGLGSIPAGAYRTVGDPPTANLQVSVTLGDEGGQIQLLNPGNTVKDTISYGQLGPAPDPIDTESTARIPSGGGYTTSWTRTPVPTFGAPNTGILPVANPPVVLNEVLFNAAVPNNRFVEVYFKGLGSANIGGYVLAGDAAFTLPAVLLSAANPFYVIRPVQAPTLFNLLTAGGDNLYLYDTTGAMLDMVGWTSAHNMDSSMVRVPDGFGTAEGYNDPTSIAAGWRFNMVPSLPLVLIGPRQTKGGDLGTRVMYPLTVTNKEPVASYANIQFQQGSQGWGVSLYMADGVTPLPDSPGDADSIPDTGQLAPEGQATIRVAVDIPPSPQNPDWETCNIIATIAGDPLASASVPLTTNIYPYEMPTSSASPSSIFVETAGPAYNPKQTVMTLNVEGRGTALFRQRPQDTVFLLDSSGSMMTNDPTNRRQAGAKHYVDLLAVPDRAAVVDFDVDAILVNGDHLSSNYPRIKTNIDTIDSAGSTNLYDPIRIATDELISYGNQSHVWVEIMLTDGDDQTGHTDAQILTQAQRARDNGIVIFTIGLVDSGGGMNEALLQQIAQLTGGIYMRAQTANDLDAIYQLIGQIVKNLAGYDNDVTDNIPMINVFLPDYIHYVVGTANPAPSYIGQFGGRTNLQWNVSKLSINETWTATLTVTSGISGTGLGCLYLPDSIVTYIRYDDTRINIPFPQAYINVMEPPAVPVSYTITRSPVMGNVTVDSVNYTAPWTFTWMSGETHTISAPDIDVLSAGERWVFVAWDDGGALTHDIVTSRFDRIITAFYSQQFRPSVTLTGLDSLHSVSAHFTSRRVAVDQPGLATSWSDWVDNDTALSFDAMGVGSNSTERWKTLSTFAAPPWNTVTSPFVGNVVYWHQVMPTVTVQGIPPTISVPISFDSFGGTVSSSTSTSWTDWVDYNSQISVGGRVSVSAVERYVNLVIRGQTNLQYSITSPRTIVVPFLRQFKPTVCLIGTNPQHTVGVDYSDSSKNPVLRAIANVSDVWTDWSDMGANAVFSKETTGSPRRHAVNETSLLVDSAFYACIVYEPPPPVNAEPNYKPLVSLAFVVVLLIFGLYWGNRKPWDRHIPPQKGNTPEEIAKKEAELRKMSISEKMQKLGLTDLQEKFKQDRHWTMTMLAMPFAVVEAITGIASLATGVLRVPDSGNWISAGLIVNSLLLLAGIIFDAFMQSKGYRIPGDDELSMLREEDLPKEILPAGVTEKLPAKSGEKERVIDTLLGLQTLLNRFIVPRRYDLVFTDSRLVCAKGKVEHVGAEGIAKAPVKYEEADLNKVLKSKRANFSIPYDSIQQLSVGGIFGKTLLISTSSKNLRSRLIGSDVEKAKSILRVAVPKFPV